MTELALPAGTLEEALVAFRAGADSVYFGMKEFSARKGAVNFSLEDLSKIRRYSREHGKKIYVTVNTLIDDRTLERAYELLSRISEIGADGIIVQDLGIARLIKRNFPNLPLHGSTQLAVHTVSGVRAMQELGFERVVLSRELTLEEIRRIRTACPDVELKVFIHGAMCYGFSGLCMASHEITGRSANEGSCAQICRTWFRDEKTGRKLYPFSLKDLDAGDLVSALVEMKIDSLKVEGRLKGLEYVDAVAHYYRAIIDNAEKDCYERNVKLSFQRSASTGYLEKVGPGHRNMLTGVYTGHQGMRIGRVIDQRGRKLLVEAKERIKGHDGLMVLLEDDDLAKPFKFSANILNNDRDRYILLLPEEKRIERGAALYLISDSSYRIKKPSSALPLSKKSIPCRIEIGKKEICVSTEQSEKCYAVTIENSENSAENAVIKCFSASGDSPFELFPITVENAEGRYINPKELKAIRRDFLSTLPALKSPHSPYTPQSENIESDLLPNRHLLDGKSVPWNCEGRFIDGKTYFSFPPVKFEEEAIYKAMEERAKSAISPVIGLNNIGDIIFAKAHPEYAYFCDIYLYLSNREAAEELKEMIPSLLGGYLWVERTEYEEPWPFTPTLIKDYKMPLFISRSCYRHDALGLDCRECKRHHIYPIEQNGRRYNVYVDDCLTVVR